MKRLAGIVVVFLVLLGVCSLYAQPVRPDTVSVPVVRLGLFGGFSINSQSLDGTAIPTLTGFGASSFTSNTFSGGALLDLHLSRAFALHLRGT